MELYKFEYCFCIFESSYETISIHKTRKTANKAMREHKKNIIKQETDLFKGEDNSTSLIGFAQKWRVRKTFLMD